MTQASAEIHFVLNSRAVCSFNELMNLGRRVDRKTLARARAAEVKGASENGEVEHVFDSWLFGAWQTTFAVFGVVREPRFVR